MYSLYDTIVEYICIVYVIFNTAFDRKVSCITAGVVQE